MALGHHRADARRRPLVERLRQPSASRGRRRHCSVRLRISPTASPKMPAPTTKVAPQSQEEVREISRARRQSARHANADRAEGRSRMGRRAGPAAGGGRQHAAQSRHDAMKRGVLKRWRADEPAAAGEYGEFWPAYVDVLSTLLLVVTLLMSIFMIAQVLLRPGSDGQGTRRFSA